MDQLVIPSSFESYAQGAAIKQQEEERKKAKKFGELFGQASGAQDRTPFIQQMGSIDPAGAMRVSEYFGQQDNAAAQKKSESDRQSAMASLYKVNAIRTAPDSAKVALYKQIAPDHYLQVTQALGRDPTAEEINSAIDLGSAELYARAGVQPPKPDVVSAETRYKTDAQKEEARMRIEAERAARSNQQAFTAEQNKMDREARVVESQNNRKATASKPTDAERVAAGYFDRMTRAEGLLGNYQPSVKDYTGYNRVLNGGAIGSSIGNTMMSEESQRYYQAASDWVRAKLRKESGAVISPQEMAQEIRTYFPIPGDSQSVIAQKADARKTATNAMKGMAGPAIQEQTSPQVFKHSSGATIEIIQ